MLHRANGADISHHQFVTDWNALKNAVDFLIIKATEGVDYVDDMFKSHASNANAVGIPIGAYHFLRAGDANAQADDFIAAIKPFKITCPVMIDVENPVKNGMVTSELSDLGAARITDMLITMSNKLIASGYRPMVYSNRNWFYITKLIDVPRLKAAVPSILLCCAWYTNANNPDNTDRSDICQVWQWCSDGTLPGISGRVDRDVAYGSFISGTSPAPAPAPVVVSVPSSTPVPAAGTYTVMKDLRAYTNAANAIARTNSVGSVKPGKYFVFNSKPGAINVTTKRGTPGSWINTADNTGTAAPTPTPKPASTAIKHTVVRGDTVYGLAKRYGTTAAAIAKLNPWLKNINLIIPGQTLVIKQ